MSFDFMTPEFAQACIAFQSVCLLICTFFIARTGTRLMSLCREMRCSIWELNGLIAELPPSSHSKKSGVWQDRL